MNFNFLKENKGFLIRIDDITDTMNWVMMNRCEKLFDDLKISDLKTIISKYDLKVHVYIFSLGDDNYNSQFSNMKNNI